MDYYELVLIICIVIYTVISQKMIWRNDCIVLRELALKVWMTSGILPEGARTFLGVIEGEAKYFFTIQEGGGK